MNEGKNGAMPTFFDSKYQAWIGTDTVCKGPRRKLQIESTLIFLSD